MSDKKMEWFMFYSDINSKTKERIDKLREVLNIVPLPRCVSMLGCSRCSWSWGCVRDLEFISYEVSGIWTLDELEKKYLGG